MGSTCPPKTIYDGLGLVRHLHCVLEGEHDECKYEFTVKRDPDVVHKNVFEGE